MFSYTYPPICRLFCPNHSTSDNDFFLDSCSVSVVIADVHASVQLSQKFRNPSSTASLDAVYTFGLLADAAVCGFEMIRADGTKVEGVVKEKEDAKREFQEAVKQGFTASLGSEETKDVFSISVGNISPSEVVTINLRYLQTLKDDEKKDQVRFTFPRTYAQRYGQAPSWNAQLASTAHQPFVLDAVIQQFGMIKSVSCPSGHPMNLELGRPDGFVVDESASDSNFAKVTLRDSSGLLTKDVILVVTATGLDSPRCFTEAHPSPERDTVAMGLTFVPRFKLPDVTNGMEYIFLVDRSGSMDGDRIKLVREALVVLLRGLPTKRTTFNIFSFGNNTTKFWDSSQAYTQSNLDAATKHVDSMTANYGGTEIAKALSSVYASLPKPLARPVAVLLLTDGSAWDVPTCVQYTQNAISSQATPENFIRVFTLGIGDGASTDTCDSIATAGQGFSVYVAANEPVVGKCARLVRAARTPPVSDLEVLWTGKNVQSEVDDDFELVDDDAVTLTDAKQPPTKPSETKPSASLSLFDDHDDAMDVDTDLGPPPKPKVTLPPPPKIQEAPLTVRNIFPGTRLQLYAIISNKQTPIPSSIKVRGKVTMTGNIVELEVPVTKMARSPQPQNHTILHTIAAKALITDREKEKHAFSPSITSSFVNNDELRTAHLTADIVRLGTTYGLTSRHTSFVAVDRRTGQTTTRPGKPGYHETGLGAESYLGGPPVAFGLRPSAAFASGPFAGASFGSAPGAMSGGFRGSSSPVPTSYGVLGGFGSSAPPPAPSRAPAFSSLMGAFSAPPVQGGSVFGGSVFGSSSNATPTAATTPHSTSIFGSSSKATPDLTSVFGLSSSPTPTVFGSSSFGVPQQQQQQAQFSPPAPSLFPTSTGSSLFGTSTVHVETAPHPSALPAPRLAQQPSPYAQHAFGVQASRPSDHDRDRSATNDGDKASLSPLPAMTEGERLAAVARLQQFDGGFSLNLGLLQSVRVELTVEAVKQKFVGTSESDEVIATVLALVWLEKYGGDESLELQEKAAQWLVDTLGDEDKVAGLKEKAAKLIQV